MCLTGEPEQTALTGQLVGPLEGGPITGVSEGTSELQVKVMRAPTVEAARALLDHVGDASEDDAPLVG